MNRWQEIHDAIRGRHARKMGQIPANRIDFSRLHADRVAVANEERVVE